MYEIRKGCKDVWNAFMVRGAAFTEHDIPYCPTTARNLPVDLITYEEARRIYTKELERKNKDFRHPVYVCFYVDNYKLVAHKFLCKLQN